VAEQLAKRLVYLPGIALAPQRVAKLTLIREKAVSALNRWRVLGIAQQVQGAERA
jgi:hypothetical protein